MHSTFTSLIKSHVIILCREVRERPGQTAQFPTNLSRATCSQAWNPADSFTQRLAPTAWIVMELGGKKKRKTSKRKKRSKDLLTQKPEISIHLFHK